MHYVRVPGDTADGYCTKLYGPYTTSIATICGAPSSGAQDDDEFEYHSFFFFDTSIIPVGAKIVKADLSVYLYYLYGLTKAMECWFYIADGDIGSSLDKTDYEVVITNGSYVGKIKGGASIGRHTMALDTTDIAQINKTGWTNVETDAVWGGGPTTPVYMYFYTANHGTAANRPYLDVWYDLEYPKIY